jgi:hypothetical protein
MSRNARNVQHSHVVHRQGEGVLIDVDVTTHIGASGTSVATVGLNLGNAPVPERSYGSDVFSVGFARGVVSMCFGQTKPRDESSLHSLLVVRMSPHGARSFLASLTQKLSGIDMSIETALVMNAGEAEEQFQMTEDPDQMVKLTANLAIIAVNNGEACIDFFNASPFSLMNMNQSRKLALQTIVRVELPASQLLGLLLALKKLENSLPAPPPEITS